MFNIGSWNTWGLNSLQKQKTVHEWTQKNDLDIFGLLETKIGGANLAAVAATLAPAHCNLLPTSIILLIVVF
jgi:exonuclease III